MKTLTDDEAKELMKKMEILRAQVEKRNSKKNRMMLHRYEAECVEKLKYFVHMRASKYRNFSNYDDLIQEGLDALIKSIRTFNTRKGSFFFWAGLFVNTRLVRSANNHSAIRYPMHIAKIVKPHKETKFPIMLDPKSSPENNTEQKEVAKLVKSALSFLSQDQKELVKMVYGFEGYDPMSIAKICEEKKITRNVCLNTLRNALDVLKDNINL